MKYLITFSLIFWYALGLHAQSDIVTWTFEVNKLADEEFEVAIQADLKEGWYLYSQHIDGDGPIPTTIHFEEQDGFELIDKTTEKGKKIEGYDKVFMMNITKYKNQVTFTQKIRLKKVAADVVGYIEFMTCDDEQCLPPRQVDFAINLE